MSYNTYAARVGDQIRELATDTLYTVTMIFPAGSMGIAHSAGPRVVASLRPGGYSVTIQHGAHRTPDQFELVERGPQ